MIPCRCIGSDFKASTPHDGRNPSNSSCCSLSSSKQFTSSSDKHIAAGDDDVDADANRFDEWRATSRTDDVNTKCSDIIEDN
mmetsp:Transcript_19973/g.40655  ORF Transcript_19973/g.40655 Transcript_19973/m.40655 type:complete len:82 (-) Transcript_19973:1684-1929(-)